MDAVIRDFYLQENAFFSLGKFKNFIKDIPDDVPSIVNLVQNLVLHVFWAKRRGQELFSEQQSQVNLRTMEEELEQLFSIDASPLNQVRELSKRLIVNCRNISLITVSLLRAKGIPARPRCGFATYFYPGKFEDHWVCEYWNENTSKWLLLDAQLNAFQQNALKIQFDPLNMPDGYFIDGGRAWQMVRRNKADPRKFGIFKYKGEMFIIGDLQRDLLALNNIILLPWDLWGFLDKRYVQLSPEELKFIDEMAVLTQLGDIGFTVVRDLYERNDFLHPKDAWVKKKS